MSQELDPVKGLRDRVQAIAHDLHLSIAVFNLRLNGDGNDAMLEIIFNIAPDAIKTKDQIEQTRFDKEFTDISKQFSETSDSDNALDNLKSWLEDYDDE